MSDSSDHPSADFRDQVEARLVAMMLGEASAFDEEQLRELLKKDSELAKFHAEMKQSIPLLKEALAAEEKHLANKVQLSRRRRRVLKHKFDGSDRLAKRKVLKPAFRRALVSAAAVLALLLTVSALLLSAVNVPRQLAQVERLDIANADSGEKTEFSSSAKKSAPQLKYSDSIRSYDESGAELGRQLTESEPAESPEGASHVDGFGVAGILVDTPKDVGLDTDGEVVDFAETGQPVVEATERYRGDPDDVEDDPFADSGEMPASYRESLRDNRRFADLAMPEEAEAPVADDLTVATGAFFAAPATSNSGGEITGLASLESRLSTMDQAAMPGFANAEPANESRPTEVWKENDSYYKRLALPPAPGTPAPGGSPLAGNSVAPKGASEFKSRSGKQKAAEWGIQTELSAMPGRSNAVEGGMVGFGASPGGGGALGGGGMGGGAGYGGMVPPATGPAPSAPTETFGDNFDGSQNGRLTVFGRDAETTDDDPAQTEPGKFAFGGRQTTGVAGKNVTVNHYGYAPVTEGKAASAQALGQAQQGQAQGRGHVLQEQNFNWAKGKEGEVLFFDVDAENEVRRERESSRAKSPRRGQAPASRRRFFSNGVVMGGAVLESLEENAEKEEDSLEEYETESLQRLAKQVDGLELADEQVAPDAQTAAKSDRGRSSRSVPGQNRITGNKTVDRIAGSITTMPAPPKPRPKAMPKPGARQELEREGRVQQLAQQVEQQQASLEEERDLNRPVSKLEADKRKSGAVHKGLKKEPPAKPVKPSVVYRPKPETVTAENAFSTFSLNVSDVSFKTAFASLQSNKLPQPSDVRSEEFLNALEYRDPMPRAGEPLAFNWERARSPFTYDRDIIRFSVKTAALGRQPGRAVNLVCLLDNSGSMEREDRERIVTQALTVLARKLTPNDRVSLVTFSRTPHVRIDGMRGGQGEAFLKASTGWRPQGGTHIEKALTQAYKTARKHFVKGGNNRVILLTDGAANMGNVDPYKLRETVEANRKQGIALDCFGIGWEGYNDNLLEVLARNGDGRYGFLNQPSQAVDEFEKKLLGAFQVAASDVKVQVEWNEKRVRVYRQVGYLRHQLKKEDFRNNKVDAAEISAAESGNAMYVVQVDEGGEGPLGVVRVRYKKPFTREYTELEWSLAYEEAALPLEQSSPAMKLASVSATFAEWLARNPYSEGVQLADLQGLMAGLASVYGTDPRPAQLEEMIRKARILDGN